MYLRISKARQNNYLVLVEGYRDNGKVKQRTICNLGPVSPSTEKKALMLGRSILNKLGSSAIIDGSELMESSRDNWGAHKILQHLWKRYQLDSFWDNQLSSRKIEYDLQNILQAMLAGRLCSPSSKLSLYENQDFYSGFANFDLHNAYKSLDELDRYKDQLCQHLFNMQQSIHGQVQIAFFDVTTMYFESNKFDDLRQFGFSKDCKFNEVQVVVSLITDAFGNPLAYDLFAGNTYEGSTLESQAKKLKEKYKIQHAVIVADRGMYSSSNLSTLSALGFEYVVGSRLRNSCKEVKDQVLSTDNYIHNAEGDFRYKTIQDKERTIIASWSKKRSDKDKQDRSRLIEKAEKLLEKGTIDDKRGGKKYLNKIGKQSVELDQAKIDDDAQWDGYYGVATNSTTITPIEAINAYHGLWRIEESFRMMKHYFETRPMFHWTPKRISGHIMLNFQAMIFEKYLEKQLVQYQMSCNDIRKAIMSMQKSIINIEKQQYASYANINQNAGNILKELKIKIPKSYQIK